MWHRHRDLLVRADLERGRFARVHAGRLEVVLERVEHGPGIRVGEGRPKLQLAHLRVEFEPIVHLPHGFC